MKGYRRVARGLMMVLATATVGACTQEARTDLAKSAFVKTVNLKCKLSKSEAKLAWNPPVSSASMPRPERR